MRELREAHEHEKITALVAQLGTDLAESPQSNLRKGALHALAGTAIGLREDVGQLLPQLLQPVLGSFSDQDARVRYYGCEALYNIAKVARAGCVKHFNPIFDGLFKLSADTDISVQNPNPTLALTLTLALALAVVLTPTLTLILTLALTRCRTGCSCSTV